MSEAALAIGGLQRCGGFRKHGVPYFGVLVIRIPLYRVLYSLASPIFGNLQVCPRIAGPSLRQSVFRVFRLLRGEWPGATHHV